jgi:hypothetical protein
VHCPSPFVIPKHFGQAYFAGFYTYAFTIVFTGAAGVVVVFVCANAIQQNKMNTDNVINFFMTVIFLILI